MSVRRIVQYDPKDSTSLLKQKCEVVKKFHDRLHKLLDDLAETMYDAHGVGLAAPQVGILKRAFVVNVGTGLIEIVNPEIVEATGWQIDPPEGCLSIPNLYGDVRRRYKVKVKGEDRNGESIEFEAEGYLARAIQHELDHLNGVLFPDRAERIFSKEEVRND